jgi:hypothetical protein
MMRRVLTTLLVAAGVGLGATSTAPAQQPSLGFYGYGGYTYGWGGQPSYNFVPACPTFYHYSCWVDPYGYKRCGCLRSERWW